MIELRIYRYGMELYRSSELIELDLDGIRYSGVEYYSQEARELKLSLLYDVALQEILEGSGRMVLAGWHAVVLRLLKDGAFIWQGMIKDGAFSLEWLGAGEKLCELRSIDMLGWILDLADKVDYRLEGSYINPAKKVCEIISAVLAPSHDPQGIAAAELLSLYQAVGPLNWQFAWLDYDYNRLLPYHLFRHQLVNRNDHQIASGGWNVNDRRFGYYYEGNDLRLIFWQRCIRRHPYREAFRQRIWSLQEGSVQLIDSLDLSSELEGELSIPPCPALAQLVWGIGNYSLEGSLALYSGPGSLRSVEIVPGDYKARDLIGEYLRLLNAVLVNDTYHFHIRNRVDSDSPVQAIFDALEANLSDGSGSPTEVSCTSLASQAIVDGVNAYYRDLMRQYPHELELKSHDLLLPGTSDTELLGQRLSFEGYEMLPGELSRDYETGELVIRGRGRRI